MRFLVVFITFFVGCSTKEPAEFRALQNPKLSGDTSLKQRSEALRAVIIGQLQSKRDQHDKALTNFEKARGLMEKPPTPLVKKIVELLVKDGKVDKALQEIETALLSTPKDKELLLFKAGALESIGKKEEARDILLDLSASHPEDVSVTVLLSAILLDFGNYKEAILRLKKSGTGLVQRVYLSRALELSGDKKGAIKVLESVKKDYPKNASARFELARLLLGVNEINRAKSELNTVLIYEPNHLASRRLLSLLSLQEKNFDSARSHLEVLESLESDPTDTRYRLALLEMEDKNYEAALRELSLVLATKPDHSEARYALATVFFSQGRKGEAITELEKIPEASSLFPKAKAILFSIYQENGELEKAESEIQKAYNFDPTNKVFLFPYISVLRSQKKYDEALEVLSKEDFNSDSRLLFMYGLTLEEAGKRQEALNTMEQVIKEDPKNVDATNYVAYVLIEEGRDLERAEKLVTEALSVKPADPYFLDTFGWLRFRQGRFGDAVLILRKAHEAAKEDEVILEHLVEALKMNGESYTEELELLRSILPEDDRERLNDF